MKTTTLTTSLISESKFKYLVISDIHLGNKRNPTSRIISNLDTYFDNYSKSGKFAKLDAIFIAGDLFDKLLDLESDDYYHVLEWMIRLMNFCHDNDIILRLLLGTPSHDRHQPKVAPIIYSAIAKTFDFEYVSTLKIERLKKSGLYILYVPDEYHPSTDETLRQVKELMAEQGISKVDISIMHGMFGYQAPIKSDKLPLHNEQEYLNLTKHYISIGHVHTFSVYERIIAQGSFDRMSHGQEEAKGAVVCTIDPVNGNNFEFIENKNALIFKTIRVKTKELDKSMAQIQKVLASIPEQSHVRIVADKNNPIIQGIRELRINCLGFNITVLTSEEEAQKAQDLLVPKVTILDDTYVPITIDKENIVELIMNQITTNYEFQNDQVLDLKVILKELVQNG